METGHATEYFLGSNSERGFFSLYSDMADTSAGDFIWLIKGGPGCGKSSFMRKIGAAAESAGFSVEYTRCSGDPDSLDAVYIPEKSSAMPTRPLLTAWMRLCRPVRRATWTSAHSTGQISSGSAEASSPQ